MYIYIYKHTNTHIVYMWNGSTSFNVALRRRWYYKQRFISLNQRDEYFCCLKTTMFKKGMSVFMFVTLGICNKV